MHSADRGKEARFHAAREANSSDRHAWAPVHEVFASIQGEGRYVGEPQVFLRLAGCPLRCAWCDTPAALAVPSREAARASIRFSSRAKGPLDGAVRRAALRQEPGWCGPFQAAVWISEVEGGSPRTVSVTGGEPLSWVPFLRELPTFVGERRLHLETSGAPIEALEEVVDLFHHISLDLKLPEDLGPPAEAGVPHDDDSWTETRRRALRRIAGRDACAKMVVAGGRSERDFRPLMDDLFELAPDIPLFIQPATAIAGVAAPGRELLESLVEAALERELTVRVVPQVHRALRIP